MSRIRLGAGKKAFIVVASLASGAIAAVQGCIPDVDISALPPYDGGVTQDLDGTSPLGNDAGGDTGATTEDGSADSNTSDGTVVATTGTITGVVLDYTQGNARGVLAGATVAVVGGAPTSTNAFGVFTLSNVPAGQVLINVSKATDETAGIAYSTTQEVVTLAAGQSISVFPVIHRGCYEIVTIGTSGVVKTNDTNAKCGGWSAAAGLFAELQYGAGAFTLPSKSANFQGLARVEMIPIGFPQTTTPSTDFGWALGLPGVGSPVETLGAAEFRILDDSTSEPLAVTSGNTSVTLTLPTWTLATAADKLSSYDPTGGAWSTEVGASASNPRTMQLVAGAGQTFDVVDVTSVSSLRWVAVTIGTAATTCVTGTITANGAPASNVFVHAVGTNFFGSATAVTDGSGAFCVDVKGVSDAGGTPQIGFLAGSSSGTTAYAAFPSAASYSVSSVAGGTCASRSGCTSLTSPIALAAFNSECLIGALSDHDQDPTIPAQLNVELQVTGLSAQQVADGISSSAYIGTTTAGDGGVFCAQAPAGSISLVGATNANCRTTQTITSAAGAPAVCSTTGTGCASVGAISFTCQAP